MSPRNRPARKTHGLGASTLWGTTECTVGPQSVCPLGRKSETQVLRVTSDVHQHGATRFLLCFHASSVAVIGNQEFGSGGACTHMCTSVCVCTRKSPLPQPPWHLRSTPQTFTRLLLPFRPSWWVTVALERHLCWFSSTRASSSPAPSRPPWASDSQ